MNKIVTLITICWALCSKAQLNIMFYPMHAFELRPTAILKADIQNMGTQASSLYFKGSIVNTTTGEQVATVRTGIVNVQPGIKTLNESELAPQYTILSDVVNQTGYLPYGNYRFCLKGYLQNGVEEEVSACEEVEITPLSPPLLLSPENQSEVTEPYPLLVWLPPMPLGKEKLVYDLKLVEILPNQTPYDAIQRNFAVLETFNINGTTLQYPANAMKLEDGKKYAWKVAVKTVDRKPLGETEIWWFTKSIPQATQLTEQPMDANYVVLDDEPNKRIVLVKQMLKVVSMDNLYVTELDYKFLDERDQEVKIKDVEVIGEGMGKFVFKFQNPKKLSGKVFKLKIKSPKGRSSIIVFKFSYQ